MMVGILGSPKSAVFWAVLMWLLTAPQKKKFPFYSKQKRNFVIVQDPHGVLPKVLSESDVYDPDP